MQSSDIYRVLITSERSIKLTDRYKVDSRTLFTKILLFVLGFFKKFVNAFVSFRFIGYIFFAFTFVAALIMTVAVFLDMFLNVKSLSFWSWIGAFLALFVNLFIFSLISKYLKDIKNGVKDRNYWLVRAFFTALFFNMLPIGLVYYMEVYKKKLDVMKILDYKEALKFLHFYSLDKSEFMLSFFSASLYFCIFVFLLSIVLFERNDNA